MVKQCPGQLEMFPDAKAPKKAPKRRKKDAAPKDAKAPTHLIVVPGAKTSMCGLKDPLPHVALAHMQKHVDGWGMVVCPDCLKAKDDARL